MKFQPAKGTSNILKYLVLCLLSLSVIAIAQPVQASGQLQFSTTGVLKEVLSAYNFSYDLSDSNNASRIYAGTCNASMSLTTGNENSGFQERLKICSGQNRSILKLGTAAGVNSIWDFGTAPIYNGYLVWNHADNMDIIQGYPGQSIDFQTRDSDGSMSVKMFINGNDTQYGNGSVNITTTLNVFPMTVTRGLSVGQGLANNVDAAMTIGRSRLGNGYSYLDLITDQTYETYGLRIIRGNGASDGKDSNASVSNRGTGELSINSVDAGTVGIYTSNTKRVHISPTGMVGIGLESPTQPLHVFGRINVSGSFINIDDGAARVVQLKGVNTTQTAAVGTVSNHPFQIETNNVRRAYFDTSGNTGLGTSSPSQRLTVNGSINISGTSGKIYLPNLPGTGSTICFNTTDSSIYRNTTVGCA